MTSAVSILKVGTCKNVFTTLRSITGHHLFSGFGTRNKRLESERVLVLNRNHCPFLNHLLNRLQRSFLFYWRRITAYNCWKPGQWRFFFEWKAITLNLPTCANNLLNRHQDIWFECLPPCSHFLLPLPPQDEPLLEL